MLTITFQDIALPLLYSHCRISTLAALRKFTCHLYRSDQKWDSIRRIPYSTPGRWVTSLDISDLNIASQSDICLVDTWLATIFPLLPFLVHLRLSSSMQLSRRTMGALGRRDGVSRLRSLKGIKYDVTDESFRQNIIPTINDPLTELVQNCVGLEELEILGAGLDDADVQVMSSMGTSIYDHHDFIKTLPPSPLNLPNLHTLTILSTPSSDLLLRLITTPLPALRNVVMTPYGDIPPPVSLIKPFLAAHGNEIRTLVHSTPKSWPTVVLPPPSDLFYLLPRLTALSFENIPTPFPLIPPPNLSSPSFSERQVRHSCNDIGGSGVECCGHPLVSIWVPRPTLALREAIITLIPSLPHLREVRARDIRWAVKGMSERAREAGFQGEMRAWRLMLGRHKVKMLDALGKEEGI